ncbi:MAG: GGDEF domain-containing protein [Pseudomonadota bacterium]
MDTSIDTDTQDSPHYRIAPWSGEFVDPATESAFREYISPFWVRDTRRAFTLAALFYLAFLITDFMLLGVSEHYGIVLATRVLVFFAGLLVAITAARYWRLLVDGITPTLVVGLAMAGFLSITLLRPLDEGWHGMSMMVMLLGTYVFIPNRFLPILFIALASTLGFFLLVLDHFELSQKQVMVMGLLFLGMNLFGAMSTYRISRLSRVNFRDAQILRQANMRLSEQVEARARLEKSLIAQVHQDDLTGAMNRRRFQELATRRLEALKATDQSLCLLLLEVDYFKQINDTYGHVRADDILRALVRLCQSHMGLDELLGRVGGDEFALLAPGLDMESAVQLAEQIRKTVWQTPISLSETTLHITVSMGLAQWRRGESLADLLRRADQALQGAKYGGRNRIQVWAGDIPRPGSKISGS